VPEYILELENVKSGYGETEILHGISMRVEKGTITALLGSNGMGKSTTLWTITGILPAWSGRIRFKGEDITDVPAHRRVEMGLVLVPEGRRLWPELTVEENLMLATFIPRAKEKIEENLELVYSLFPVLKERRRQKAGTLSGGEQQMLAIARGLMLNPELFMLDEPSLGLAPKLVQEIASVLKRLNEEEGLTILLVEQNVHIALQISHYAYVIETGLIKLEGPAREIAERPEIKKAYLGL